MWDKFNKFQLLMILEKKTPISYYRYQVKIGWCRQTLALIFPTMIYSKSIQKLLE